MSVTHERQWFTTYLLQKCNDTSGSSNTGLKLEVHYTCECVHVVDVCMLWMCACCGPICRKLGSGSV